VTIAAALGDMNRFATAPQLIAYFGLVLRAFSRDRDPRRFVKRFDCS
jgi:hypothetical protein